MNGKNWDNDNLFIRIRNVVPIAAVDILAVHNGRLLLLLKNNEPEKNVWFTPGGRIRYDETLEKAAKRKLLEETGLRAVKSGKRGTICQLYPEAQYVTTFFHVEATEGNVRLNDEHRDYRWISNIETDLHPYVEQMIEELEIFT